MATIRITSVAKWKDTADHLIGLMVEQKKLKADQAKEINIVKKKYDSPLKHFSKEIANAKRKIGDWGKKNGLKIFGNKEVGTITTNHAQIKIYEHPSSIKRLPEFKDTSEEDLVLEAKKKGYGNVIKITESLSIEAMEKLTDSELNRLGFQRIKGTRTCTVDVLSDKENREKVVLTPPTE